MQLAEDVTPPRRRASTPESGKNYRSPVPRGRNYEGASNERVLVSPIPRKISEDCFTQGSLDLSIRSPSARQKERVKLDQFIVSSSEIGGMQPESRNQATAVGTGFLTQEAIQRLHRQATNERTPKHPRGGGADLICPAGSHQTSEQRQATLASLQGLAAQKSQSA